MISKLNNSGKPFIHLFSTSGGKYLYDVNTDKILKLPEEVYNYLKSSACNDSEDNKSAPVTQYIENLRCNGYLSENKVRIIEHPMTEMLQYYINNNISYMILQLTQSCNLRCHYCVFSGNYHNRSHSPKKMSKETAKKAIEYYIGHSRDTRGLAIGFYGGEPLLCMDMIKFCVAYADENSEGRKIKYSLTTNGTLLKKELIQYFVEHNFVLTISLDGPAAIHDKNRRFAKNDEGSFNTIINNIRYIRETYPAFYAENVMFNTVLDPLNDFNCINDYIMNSEEFDKSFFSSTLIDDRYTKNEIPYKEEFITDREYEVFKLYLSKLGRLKEYTESKLVKNDISSIKRIKEGMKSNISTKLPEKSHRGGPCLPGVIRLFVNADGVLYPCERVSEASEVTRIGDVDNGIDIKRADRLLNIERFTSQMCHDCWAYRNCQICVGSADDLTDVSPTIIKERCPRVRQQVEETFKDYCILKELGYDFESEDIDKEVSF